MRAHNLTVTVGDGGCGSTRYEGRCSCGKWAERGATEFAIRTLFNEHEATGKPSPWVGLLGSDPTPARRPPDELRERCVEASHAAYNRWEAWSEGPGVPPGLPMTPAESIADAVIPLVVEHIAAHFDRSWPDSWRMAAREIRSTYGQ